MLSPPLRSPLPKSREIFTIFKISLSILFSDFIKIRCQITFLASSDLGEDLSPYSPPLDPASIIPS